jgi:hypothetical protein
LCLLFFIHVCYSTFFGICYLFGHHWFYCQSIFYWCVRLAQEERDRKEFERKEAERNERERVERLREENERKAREAEKYGSRFFFICFVLSSRSICCSLFVLILIPLPISDSSLTR